MKGKVKNNNILFCIMKLSDTHYLYYLYILIMKTNNFKNNNITIISLLIKDKYKSKVSLIFFSFLGKVI